MLTTLIFLTVIQTASFSSGDRAYSKQQPLYQEKLHLHVAEEVLLTGQRIWFKAYLVKEGTSPGTDGSKVVYVELLSTNGQQVLASKLRVLNSGIKGEFLLPESLSSGWYTLRAYTQWMRNFSDNAYFQKDVLVINPFESDVEEKLSATSSAPVTFYPEGGNLVAGLDNHIVFRVNEQSSQDLIVQAEVLSGQDSILSTALLAPHGLGSFQLKPASGEAYTLRIITEANDTLVNTIPPARKQGYGMRVTRSDHNFHVAVQTNQTPAEDIILLVLSQGEIVYSEALNRTDRSWSVNINSDKIAGLGRIALVTSNGNMLAERLVYAPREASIQVLVTPDKLMYTPGEAVNLRLKFQDNQGQPIEAFSSLAVRKATPLHQYLSENELPAYADLKSQTHAETDRALHQWLVMKQANPVNWKSLLSPQKQKIQYRLENEGMLLSGTLTNNQGEPLADTLLIFSVPGEDPKFDYYYTDERGKFFFPVNNIYGKQETILQLPRAEGYRISIDDKYAAVSHTLSSALVPVLPSEWMEEFLEKSRKRSEINQIYGLYKDDTAASGGDQKKKDSFRFYGAPNFVRILDDYISLPTFEEVRRELMPSIRLTKKNGEYDLDVFNIRTRNFLDGEPALLIDGVPVYKIDPLVNMSPDTIDRIETVNRRTYYGEFSLDGTVAIYTKNGKEYLQFLSSDAFRQTISFYDQPLSFTETSPEAIQSIEKRMPDFRTLLFWEADIKPDEQGIATLTFYNSDETGTFEVMVEGVTADGERFTKAVTYEVNFLNE